MKIDSSLQIIAPPHKTTIKGKSDQQDLSKYNAEYIAKIREVSCITFLSYIFCFFDGVGVSVFFEGESMCSI